jgi:hypothetical protein
MTMRPIKLRPRDPDLPERKVRLRLTGRLAADLDAYREIYARTHGREIELPALVESILEQFLATDRGFQRRRAVDPTTAYRASRSDEPNACLRPKSWSALVAS